MDLNLASFDFAALLIYIIVLFSTFVRRLTRGFGNQVFVLMLMIMLFTCLMQCLANAADLFYKTIYTLPDGTLDPCFRMPFWRTLLSYGYYGTRHLAAPVYLFYTAVVTNTLHLYRRKPLLLVLLCMPAALAVLAVALNPLTHAVFTMGPYGSLRGPQMAILYCSAVFYMLVSVCHLVRWRRVISRAQFIALVSLFPLNLIAVFMQFLYRGIQAEMLMTSITTLLLATVIEPPEGKIDELVGVGSYAGYADLLAASLITRARLSLVYLQITNYDSLMLLGSKTRFHQVLRSLVSPLLAAIRRYGMGNVFYLRDGLFCCVVRDGREEMAPDCARELRSILAGTHRENESDLLFEVSAVTLQVPDDVDSMEVLQRFVGHFYTLVPKGCEVVSFKELARDRDFRLKCDIDSIIAGALEKGSFKMWLQPIMNVHTMRYESAEALIRLIDDEYGFVSPGLFIPEAESTGAIMPIGEFVLKETMALMGRCGMEELGLKYVEINLSVEQCIQPGFADHVSALAARAQLLPEQVNLEVTETAVSRELGLAEENTRRLKAAGFTLSLDDYGTGYSNLVRFISLPFDIVKIDKTLVDRVGQREMDAVIRSTIESMHSIGRTVLAEGVETKEQAQALIDMGIDHIQGFFYARPMPEEDFVRFVRDKGGQGT